MDIRADLFKSKIEESWIKQSTNEETRTAREWCCNDGHKDFYDHGYFMGCYCGLMNKHRYIVCEVNLEDFENIKI